MRISVLLAGLGVSMSLFAAPDQTIYKIEKEDGTIVYTDTPSKHSEPVSFDAHTSNVTESLPSMSKAAVSPTDTAPKQKEAAPPDYQIVVSHPAPEATIRDNNGAMTISASSQPASSGTYQLTMDEKVVKTNRSGKFSLTGVVRGEHRFSIQLINNKGKTLASSKEQTFYMHQASALINNQNSQ